MSTVPGRLSEIGPSYEAPLPDPFFFRQHTGPLPMWMLRSYMEWINPYLKKRWEPKIVFNITFGFDDERFVPGKNPGDNPVKEPYRFARTAGFCFASDFRSFGDYILPAVVRQSQIVADYYRFDGAFYDGFVKGTWKAEEETETYKYPDGVSLHFVRHLKDFDRHVYRLLQERRKPIEIPTVRDTSLYE